MYPVEPAERGLWPYSDFPDAVEIDGNVFVKAIRKQPYAGVIEQYRQETPEDSAHLMVLESGIWVIDHVDEYNPDLGHPVKHFMVDHPIGRVLTYTAGGVVAMGLAIIAGKRSEKRGKP